VLLVDMDEQAAENAAERLRAAVAEAPIACAGVNVPVRLSAGVASVRGGSQADFDALVASADAALYVAKESGRNRVVVSAA
jgi:diguanylate cyclase (GGDEF)-like protein